MRRKSPGSYFSTRKGRRVRDTPVFDRSLIGVNINAELNIGLTVGAGGAVPPMHRTAADRQPARETVTARILGDPPAHRAGRAPDCEDSLRAERSIEAYRLLGLEPPNHERYAVMDLDAAQERMRRLAPRRWKPRIEAAE